MPDYTIRWMAQSCLVEDLYTGPTGPTHQVKQSLYLDASYVPYRMNLEFEYSRMKDKGKRKYWFRYSKTARKK